ncbi:hypothetical protein N0V84_002197 [Fusarium piperis]|uniref:Uncharacterized protein n=1 Tax=Fusarium piperis TaxID=1435070 RepID=A0A9W9BTA3_9HYPO|nr:hypothetical protein N0V84_002197 [Fusarium piperis]
MCFFYQSVWTCGYWKWAGFHQRCHKEHRVGETCGLKLVSQCNYKPTPCNICQRIKAKVHRIEQFTGRMERLKEWNLISTYEKCQEETAIMQTQLAELRRQHDANTKNVVEITNTTIAKAQKQIRHSDWSGVRKSTQTKTGSRLNSLPLEALEKAIHSQGNYSLASSGGVIVGVEAGYGAERTFTGS